MHFFYIPFLSSTCIVFLFCSTDRYIGWFVKNASCLCSIFNIRFYSHLCCRILLCIFLYCRLIQMGGGGGSFPVANSLWLSSRLSFNCYKTFFKLWKSCVSYFLLVLVKSLKIELWVKFWIAGACYSMGLRDNHSCIENATKNSCPVCYEVVHPQMEPDSSRCS